MNNCISERILHGIFAEFCSFFCIFSEFGHFWTDLWNSGFFSSKFRREIAILMQKIAFFCITIDFFFAKKWRFFCWKIEFWAVQKYVNLVDLEKCWKMTIWLQKSVSIQQRTSLWKFWRYSSIYSFGSLEHRYSIFDLSNVLRTFVRFKSN